MSNDFKFKYQQQSLGASVSVDIRMSAEFLQSVPDDMLKVLTSAAESVKQHLDAQLSAEDVDLNVVNPFS